VLLKIKRKLFTVPEKLLAFDTETTGITPWGDFKRWGFYPARPFAFSFCDMDGKTSYYRGEVKGKTREVCWTYNQLSALKGILENPKYPKVGHNVGYDIRMCEMLGIKVQGEIHDTLILAHVFTGGSEFTYGLKEISKKYMEFDDEDESELHAATVKARREAKKKGWCLASKDQGRDPVKADYWMAPPLLCEKYARQDSERTMLLFLAWYPKVMADPNMRKVYEREMALARVVKKMENRGTRYLPEQAKKLFVFYNSYAKEQQKICNANGGKDLNFRSPKQMVEVFINKRKHTPIAYTKTGQPQINGDFLKHLADTKNDKLARAILEYRGSTQMIKAFLNPYERFKVEEYEETGNKLSRGLHLPKTWVLHPNYRQCGPVTGRFSCGDPNLMQVASPTTGRRRTEITLRPREAFGPRNGTIWYLPDYSQIEVWVFSFLAQEQAMMKALLEGRDFHGAVAQTVWGKEPNFEKEASYFRKRAKLLMFCKLYGGGVNKVAYLTDSSPADAAVFVDQFNKQLPGIQTFMKRMINRAEREGKIINPLGRTYYIEPNFSYKAVNYLVQGTSADILKNAMIRINDLFEKRWKGCHILLTLHDELVMEIPLKYHGQKLMKEIITEMQRDSKLVGIPVPLPVGMKIAKKYWSETEEIESLTDEWKEKYLCKKLITSGASKSTAS